MTISPKPNYEIVVFLPGSQGITTIAATNLEKGHDFFYTKCEGTQSISRYLEEAIKILKDHQSHSSSEHHEFLISYRSHRKPVVVRTDIAMVAKSDTHLKFDGANKTLGTAGNV